MDGSLVDSGQPVWKENGSNIDAKKACKDDRKLESAKYGHKIEMRCAEFFRH